MLGLAFVAVSSPVSALAQPTTGGVGPAAPAVPPGCVAPLTLVLRPGIHLPGHAAPAHLPADLPHGTAVVRLPLYPGARPTNQPFVAHFEVNPFWSYVKTGSSEFALPLGIRKADAWYRTHFVQCGYNVEGTGFLPSPITIRNSGLEFASRSVAGLQVAVSIHAQASGGTLVLYTALEDSRPVRARSSYLPNSIARVHVTYFVYAHPFDEHPRQVSFDATAPSTIRRLVSAVNALTEVYPARAVCQGPPVPAEARLIFVRPNGATIRVIVDVSCLGAVIVGRYHPLIDTHGRVGRLVTSLTRTRCRGNIRSCARRSTPALSR